MSFTTIVCCYVLFQPVSFLLASKAVRYGKMALTIKIMLEYFWQMYKILRVYNCCGAVG